MVRLQYKHRVGEYVSWPSQSSETRQWLHHSETADYKTNSNSVKVPKTIYISTATQNVTMDQRKM